MNIYDEDIQKVEPEETMFLSSLIKNLMPSLRDSYYYISDDYNYTIKNNNLNRIILYAHTDGT